MVSNACQNLGATGATSWAILTPSPSTNQIITATVPGLVKRSRDVLCMDVGDTEGEKLVSSARSVGR